MKYKVCPACGERNKPSDFECMKCGIDITNVNPTDEENEQFPAPQPPAGPVMVRICVSCGHHNPVNAGQCQRCQDDLTGIIPTAEEGDDSQSQSPAQATLLSLDEQYAFELPAGETTVGRQEVMSEYLRTKPFVSRRHAMFRLADGKLTVTNLSQSNYTFVNNMRCPSREVELHDGDIIGLGGNECDGKRQDDAAYFLVRLCACT
ncbi:MAG: FHA domain-containing protein [Aristaeellaceae bacterium]